MTMRKIMVFSRFERFWHWTQMLFIFSLLFTGFVVRGLIPLIDFETAVVLHVWSAIGLLILWILATFWLLTTGTWKHFLPTTEGLWRVMRFYAYGIFKGEHHPYKKAYLRKHNPLQALAYLWLKLIIFPLLWSSGIVYLVYRFWSHIPNATHWLEAVSLIHVSTAFLLLVFVIVHVYMLTIGHSITTHIKPMITGYDEIELTEAEEAFLEESRTITRQ